MSNFNWVLLGFTAVLLTEGLIGYFKAGSRVSLLLLWLPLVGESKVHARWPHGLDSACNQRPAGGI
jgi:hypothetical protein